MIGKDRIERVILTSCTSESGKWRLLLAEHIVAGSFCYDVIGLNTKTGITTSRHYRNPLYGDDANKAEALRVYNDYREKLGKIKGKEEKDEPKRETRIILPN